MGYSISKKRKYVVSEDYKFFFVLYPDSDSSVSNGYVFNEVMEKIQITFKSVAFALHDNDIDANGVVKKPHVHVYASLSSKDRRSIKWCSEKLGVPDFDLDFSWNTRGSVRYLIHLDNPDKYQYPPDIIVSNFDHEKFLKVDSSVAISQFYDWIYSVLNNDPKISYARLRYLAHLNNFDSLFVRCSSDIRSILRS